MYGSTSGMQNGDKTIDKLRLKVQKHHFSYHIQWLSKGDKLQVHHKCLVNYSIAGRYRDQISCDVVRIDTNILLGGPCIYDSGIVNEPKADTYNFIKDG